MLHYRLVWFLLLFFCANEVSSEAERCAVRVRIDSGWVCGARRSADHGLEYASYQGIPYARQPVAELRFQELQPVITWNHYLDATTEGPACPQHDENFGRLMKTIQGTSEACIYANVYVPFAKDGDAVSSYEVDRLDDCSPKAENDCHREKAKGFPILVYIHGGGFQSGSGDSDMNGPESLIRRGVIVITFNYRLNVFGFLYLNTPKVPGNQGLRDAVTLLRWVKRNARAFGGDPDNVTLMGQSAGSVMAHLLSLSKATNGLFRRVILSSGTANPGFYTTSPLFSKSVAALFLSRLGINSTDPDDIHDQLVSMPLNRILLANSEVQYTTGVISFCPVLETSFPGVTRIIDDDPNELIKRRRGNQYPLMIGYNTAECEYFRPRTIYLDFLGRIEANPTTILNPRITFRTPPNVSLRLARQTIRRYFKRRLTYDEYIKSCSDTFFEYPTFQLANLRASTKGAPVFLYQFSYESVFSFVKEARWLKYKGTAHVEDFFKIFRPNAFIAETGKKQLPFRDRQMEDWMTTFVSNFMRCSNPTCSKLRQSPWPKVQQDVYNYQLIEEPMVYRNSKPTSEQWAMIDFFKYIEGESRRAVAEQGALTDGTSLAEAFMTNFTVQLGNFQRPKYQVALVYRSKNAPKLKFKEFNPANS